MDRGFYTSVSAMMTGTKQLADIANNIANVNTIGYKKDKSIKEEFTNLMINKMDENIYVGDLVNQTNLKETYTLFSEGSISSTGLKDDNAIIGEGFFKVDKEGTIMYTRDGSFKIDKDGYLVTSNGYFVLDKDNQRMLVDKEEDYTGRLGVVNFDNFQTLERTEHNLFVNKFGLSDEIEIENPYIKNGFLEMSNVDVSKELTDMIEVQRYFQFNQRSLTVRDELLEKIAEFR